MRRETLAAIVKLRQQAITDAKKHLAVTIADESRAQAKAQEADRQLLSEAEAASDVNAGDEVVEAYARWLPTGLQQALAGRTDWESATVEVSHARATLDAARAAAEMAEDAAGMLEKADTALRLRREQAELDEHGTRFRPTR